MWIWLHFLEIILYDCPCLVMVLVVRWAENLLLHLQMLCESEFQGLKCNREMPVKTHIEHTWDIILGCKHLNSMGILQGSRNRAATRKEKFNTRYGRRANHSNYKKQACKSLQNSQESWQQLSYFHSMRKEKHVYKLWVLPAGDDPWLNHSQHK